jgi:hypothetical protein
MRGRRSDRRVRDDSDAAYNLRDVVLDQELCAVVCAIVEFGWSDVSKVADETASYVINKFRNIALLFGLKKSCQALMD